MTDCPRTDIRDALPDWVHGSLDDAATADVAEHLSTCATCAAEAQLLRSIRAVMPREPRIDVQRVAAAVVERTSSPRRSGHRGPGWRTALGGVAVAASVALGVLLIQRDDRATASPDPVVGGLADLRVDQLETLLHRLDAIEALPQTSPAPTLITHLEVR